MAPSPKDIRKAKNLIDRFYWQARANEPVLRKMNVEQGKDLVCTYLLRQAFKRLDEQCT